MEKLGITVFDVAIIAVACFGALLCAFGFFVGGLVAIVWMLNALFGWFEDQLIAVKAAFTKVEAEETEEEDAEEPEAAPRKKTKKKSGKSQKGGK